MRDPRREALMFRVSAKEREEIEAAVKRDPDASSMSDFLRLAALNRAWGMPVKKEQPGGRTNKRK